MTLLDVTFGFTGMTMCSSDRHCNCACQCISHVLILVAEMQEMHAALMGAQDP